MKSDSFGAIDEFIEKGMRRFNIPGVALAIIEGDHIVHQRGFGRARPGGEPPTPATPFYIGSITKSITALAVMQLVEAGKIQLDAPVQRYLPWFRVADPQASAQMTVRHLLNQTSGLPESAGELSPADFEDRPDASERRARTVASLELKRPVGAACEYSNMNYDLLGLIIQATSGKPYEDYIQDCILTPLEMHHTYTTKAKAEQNGLAMGYRYWFGIPFAAPNLPIPYGSLPSGLLISTAEDLSHLLIAHLRQGRYKDVRVLSSSGIDEMQRGAVEYGHMGVSVGKYAMGLFDSVIGQSRLVWHGGTMPDFGSYMAIFPQQDKGTVLLFNACHWWYNPVLTEFGMGATALLAGEKYRPTVFSTWVPRILRAQLLIPAFQLFDVGATLRMLRGWHRRPERRPSGDRIPWKHLLISLIPELMIALSLRSVFGKRRTYLKLFMPDFSWIAVVCGSLAGIWVLLRTGLVLGSWQKTKS